MICNGNKLSKMKLLLIDNDFYDYSTVIIEELNKRFEIERLLLSPCLSLVEQLFAIPFKYKYISKKNMLKQKSFISNITDLDYDYVFCLGGQFLDYDFLKLLKSKIINASFILYLWDSIANLNQSKETINLFDKVISFDSEDCKKKNFEFLPLFYIKVFKKFSFKKNIDLFYCANFTYERFNLLKHVVEFTVNHNINFNSNILMNKYRYRIYCWFNKEFRDYKRYFTYSELKHIDYAKKMCESKVVIDLHHRLQTGLTMRTIEALASQCKLFTTNEHIKEYDFYCPENVMIIDRENPVFDVDFIKSPYKPISKEIVEKYSLENWVKQIFKD